MQGPHDSDDFMKPADRKMLYNSSWSVGHSSNRTGVRLGGHVPEWARTDGGEGGSHPSNVFDYGYPSPGGMNWTGESPIVFMMDSPNLGGLICSTTVVSADLWRMGQMNSGDPVKFSPVLYEDAVKLSRRVALRKQIREYYQADRSIFYRSTSSISPRSSILRSIIERQ